MSMTSPLSRIRPTTSARVPPDAAGAAPWEVTTDMASPPSRGQAIGRARDGVEGTPVGVGLLDGVMRLGAPVRGAPAHGGHAVREPRHAVRVRPAAPGERSE